jgi:hypothetical protein
MRCHHTVKKIDMWSSFLQRNCDCWMLSGIEYAMYFLIGQNWMGLVGTAWWCGCTPGEFTMAVLAEFFGDHVITKNLWPPRYHRTWHHQIFTSGTPEDRMCKETTPPPPPKHTLAECPPNIERCVETISVATLCHVSASMIRVNYGTGKCKSLPTSSLAFHIFSEFSDPHNRLAYIELH